MNTDKAFDVVRQELERATGKFGCFASGHEGYAVIKEELDELWEEIKKRPGGSTNLRLGREATQVAAMAIRFLVDIVR